MDPNQTPAGPDGPDKEKMEQVSRLVHPLSRHCGRWSSRWETNDCRYRFEHGVWPSWATQLPQSRRRARLQKPEAHLRLLLRSRALQPPRANPRPRRPRSPSHRRPSRPQTLLRSSACGRANRPTPKALQVLFVLLARGPPLKLTTSFQHHPRVKPRPSSPSRMRTMPIEF